MKKNIFLLLSITSLTACATFQQQPAFDWHGQNFDSYVLQYGVPSSRYTLQDGNNVFSFKRNCPQTNTQEEILFTVNTENTIQEIYLTSTCPTVQPPPTVVQPVYVTKYIETPAPKSMPKPQVQIAPKPKPVQDKPAPKPQDKPAPKPQGQVAPKPQDKPVADKPKPVQDKPSPKPQEQVAPKPQDKPIADKPKEPAKEQPAPKPQDKTDKKINQTVNNNQVKEKKETSKKTEVSLTNTKSSKELSGEKTQKAKQNDKNKTGSFSSGATSTQKHKK